MKISIEFPNGDVFTTAPDRLQLAPANDGKSVVLIAGNHPVAAFSGQLIPPSTDSQPVSAE